MMLLALSRLGGGGGQGQEMRSLLYSICIRCFSSHFFTVDKT